MHAMALTLRNSRSSGHHRNDQRYVPPLQYNRDGESVNLPIQAQSVSVTLLTYSVKGLPAGLTPDPATGVISGALVTHFSVPTTDYVTVSVSDGNDFNSTQFPWNIVPAGASDAVALFNPGSQFNSEGDYVSLSFFDALGDSSLGLPLQYSATGLPPGLTFIPLPRQQFRYVCRRRRHATPYDVTVTATDGDNSDSIHFLWTVQAATVVSLSSQYSEYNRVGDDVDWSVTGTTNSGLPLTYSASGLPNGLSINPATGEIMGTVQPLAALPQVFDVVVTATDGLSQVRESFLWSIYGPASTSSNSPILTAAEC